MIPSSPTLPENPSDKIPSSKNLTFGEFIRKRRIVPGTRTSQLAARIQTLINAKLMPSAYSCWAEFFRACDRQRIRGDDIPFARQIWAEYTTKREVRANG